jgi:hypothetical protein
VPPEAQEMASTTVSSLDDSPTDAEWSAGIWKSVSLARIIRSDTVSRISATAAMMQGPGGSGRRPRRGLCARCFVLCSMQRTCICSS